jgi:glycosyltransferase involved in cell wall biosynthesis
VIHREIPVHRVPHPPQGGWYTLRFLRRVARWLRDHRGEFDVVYVANLRNEAYATIGALQRDQVPVVVRAGEHDVAWQQQARFGRRVHIRCQRADAIVVNTAQSAQTLVEAGYEPQRIHEIPWGVPVAPQRSSAARIEARKALAAANHDLAADDVTPVAICVTRLDNCSALRPLVATWKIIAARWPGAKLWLIGDGPHRHDIYDVVVERGMHRDIFMPGSFDELEDVFQAADLCIAADQSVAESPALLQAMASGLPIIANDTDVNRDLVNDNVQGLLVQSQDVAALTSAISKLLETPHLSARMSAAARLLVSERHASAASAASHLSLFEQLVTDRRNSV